MNLKEFLDKKGRLTQRERELIIEAWIEASYVFDVSATRAAEQRNEAETSIREACSRKRHVYLYRLGFNTCPDCEERLHS